jgi:hypothetical protein
MKPAIKQAVRAYSPVFMCIAGAVAVISILLIGIRITGIEIINIYLQTSYYDYPVILIGVPLLLATLYSALAVQGICRLRKGLRFRTPDALMIIAPALTILFCVLALSFFQAHCRRVHTGEPSARERLSTRIGPVLEFGPFRDRRADASSGAVVWYFDPVIRAAPDEILFGPGPRTEQMAGAREESGDGRRHEFHLTGLAPSTRYYYRVPAWGGRVYSFRTGPARGSGAPFRFMVLADTGNTKRGDSTPSYFHYVMRAADNYYTSANDLPAFRLHAGDMVRSGADLESWREYFSSGGGSDSVPGVFTPGNHEYLEDGGSNFRYFFGQPDYYSIDYGDARVISLHPFDGPGRTLDGPILSTGSSQYRWVRDELVRSGGVKWLIVVIHIPLLSTGDYGTNEILMAQYFDLFRKHGVSLVVSGHDHNVDLFDTAGGPLYLVAGTGGSHLDSYIMFRRVRGWPSWINEPDIPAGPPNHPGDALLNWRHVYGELSWGFTDVDIRDNAMKVTYCRWLGFDRFLQITGQDSRSWGMLHLDEAMLTKNGLFQAEQVKKIVKSLTLE